MKQKLTLQAGQDCAYKIHDKYGPSLIIGSRGKVIYIACPIPTHIPRALGDKNKEEFGVYWPVVISSDTETTNDRRTGQVLIV